MNKLLTIFSCVFFLNPLFGQSGFKVTAVETIESSKTDGMIHNRYSAQGNFVGHDTIEFNLKIGFVNDMKQKEVFWWVNRSFDDVVKVIDDCSVHRLEELTLEGVFIKLLGWSNRMAFFFKDGASYYVLYPEDNLYRPIGKCN